MESGLTECMAVLDLKVNRAQASGNALVVSSLTVILGTGIIYLLWAGMFADEGVVGWLLFIGFVTWMFTFLTGWTLRLVRLRSHKGPFLRITDQGIVDFSVNPNHVLVWNEIEYAEWKNPSLAPVLAFVPKVKSVTYRLRLFLGIPSFQYRSAYLDAPNEEIAQFLIEHAPQELLR